MKLVITIDDDIYDDYLKQGATIPKYGTVIGSLYEALWNGTPLPEPFDLEGLKSDMKALNCGFPYGLDYLLDCLDKRLGITIIEAESEGDSE